MYLFWVHLLLGDLSLVVVVVVVCVQWLLAGDV